MLRKLLICSLLPALAITSALGCSDTYDVVVDDDPAKPALLDDTAPPEAQYDASLDYLARSGYVENHSQDRFRFDVAPFATEAERADATKLYPSHAAYLAAHAGALPSVQTIGTYEKQLDDQIYAGVERSVQEGLAPTLAPKRALLSDALAYLVAHRSSAADEAIAVVAAAIEEGGADADVPADLTGAVAAVKSEFEANAELSKPIGFYGWSDELRGVFRQDRLLQQALEPGAACALAGAIAADPAREQRYRALLDLYTRMTNPLESSLADLLPIASGAACSSAAAASPHAFLSASTTPEVELFRKLYPNGAPPGADLMQDFIDAIRAGTIDLTPGEGDGWYAYQLYALETLLVTDHSEERAKVAFMAKYKKRLQEAFETMVTQHRETHVKQANTEDMSSAEVHPLPDVRVEPLATVFVRHARSYVFLEAALDAVMGPSFLDGAVTVDEHGPTTTTLRAQIRASRDLFFGLYLVACQDVGLPPKLDAPGDPKPEERDALAKAADAWLLGLANDPVAGADVRVMIPIAEIDEAHWRYWAVVGVRTTLAAYSFLHGTDTSAPPLEDEWRVALPTEQFVEVTSSATPLGREEFRALCDQYQTADAIVSALEAR